VDAGRIGTEARTYDLKGGENLNKLAREGAGDSDDAKGCGAFGIGAKQETIGQATVSGRYPANIAFECICEKTEVADEPDAPNRVLHNQSSESIGAFKTKYRETHRPSNAQYEVHTNPDCPAAMLNEQSGDCGGGDPRAADGSITRTKQQVYGEYNKEEIDTANIGFRDSGGASRFFYCAKASSSERKAGLPENPHPTVKPINLTRWLAAMLLPPVTIGPRRLLVPFSGSGSEIIGAHQAGWDEITGVEMDPEYVKIAEARLAYWKRIGVQTSLFGD
jgi:hypothetical protein